MILFLISLKLIYSLSSIKEQLNIFQEQVQEEMSKTFCCLCCGSPPLTVNYSLPVRGYVPGQSMPIKVNVENSSGITVDTVKLILCKVYSIQ